MGLLSSEKRERAVRTAGMSIPGERMRIINNLISFDFHLSSKPSICGEILSGRVHLRRWGIRRLGVQVLDLDT